MSLARTDEIQTRWPDLHWPYSADGTQRLIRLGRLRAVKVGRNVFVTRALLEEFIARHTTAAAVQS